MPDDEYIQSLKEYYQAMASDSSYSPEDDAYLKAAAEEQNAEDIKEFLKDNEDENEQQ